MPKNIMNIFSFKGLFPLFSCLIILFSSCSSSKEPIAYQEKTFAEENWTYDQRIVRFESEIERSEEPCEVLLDLQVTDETFKLSKLETTVSIYSPGESESHRIATFLFNDNGTPKTTKDGVTTYTLSAYPEKYFSETGTYKFCILQKSSHYDMRGVKSVALRVLEKEVKE